MDRLTERHGRYITVKGCKTIHYCIERKSAPASNAVVRLAAYEDTGLMPEEIIGLCSMDRRAKMAEILRKEKNAPLTLEELREMDGEPVWVEIPEGRVAEWCIAKWDPLMGRTRLWGSGGGWFDGRNCGKSVFAYRRRPDREAVEA